MSRRNSISVMSEYMYWITGVGVLPGENNLRPPTLGAGVLSLRVKRGRAMTLTTNPQLVSR